MQPPDILLKNVLNIGRVPTKDYTTGSATVFFRVCCYSRHDGLQTALFCDPVLTYLKYAPLRFSKNHRFRLVMIANLNTP